MPARALGRVATLGLLLLAAACGDVSREGTYSGPKDTFVKVANDTVVELRLTYSGNVGLKFASASVTWTGNAAVDGDAFTVRTAAAVVSGRFVDGNRKIDGTWQEGEVTGTWSAAKD